MSWLTSREVSAGFSSGVLRWRIGRGSRSMKGEKFRTGTNPGSRLDASDHLSRLAPHPHQQLPRVYDVKDRALTVLVLRIGCRGEMYRTL